MGGRITDEQPPAKYDWQAVRPLVYRYVNGDLKYLPNVFCTGVAQQEGPNAGHARFEYIFDQILASDSPYRIEHVLPAASGRGVVRTDDRIVVGLPLPTGKIYPVFDGFAQIPEAGLSPTGEHVSFQAMATPVRCYDKPIIETRWRQASTPNTTTANRLTGLRAVFNPDGRGNSTDWSYPAHIKQASGSYRDYPVFLDPAAVGARSWVLSKAVAYLLGEYNTSGWVKNPSLTELVSLLDCWEPSSPDGPIDPGDPSTYTKQPIAVTDEDVTNLPWPEAVHGLISPHGFLMQYVLEADSSGLPTWRLRFYKSNDWQRLYEKPLMLQAPGATVDPGRSNVGAVRLAYDAGRIVNSYVCRSKPAEYEASFMLAPLGWEPSGGDTSNLEDFKTGASGFDTVRNKYRLYGLDELGKGHWSFATGATVTTAPDLTSLLGGADADPQSWVQRARPGKAGLFSKDSAGRPRRAVLEWCLASAYTGPVPGVWNGTAPTAFQQVKGGWRLLDDQLGVYIEVEDPSRLQFSDHSSAHRGGVLSLVEAMTDSTKRLYFRLTCVVEGDQSADAQAGRRGASPTSFTIQRAIDASSRSRPQLVSRWSRWGGNDDSFARDDLREQVLQAYAKRFATEVPPFAGPVTIPWHTPAYAVGDRITGVNGRGWDLTASTASTDGEGRVLPRVVAVEWQWGEEESTTLHLSDLRVGRKYGRG